MMVLILILLISGCASYNPDISKQNKYYSANLMNSNYYDIEKEVIK